MTCTVSLRPLSARNTYSLQTNTSPSVRFSSMHNHTFQLRRTRYTATYTEKCRKKCTESATYTVKCNKVHDKVQQSARQSAIEIKCAYIRGVPNKPHPHGCIRLVGNRGAGRQCGRAQTGGGALLSRHPGAPQVNPKSSKSQTPIRPLAPEPRPSPGARVYGFTIWQL